MRLYKLLKDTPTIKAGTTFREVVSDFDGARELARVTPIGAKTSPQFTIQDIDNFEEWFEEIEEPTDSIHWKPQLDDRYWSIDYWGNVDCTNWGNTTIDVWKLNSGNVYRTEEECEKAKERRLAKVRLEQTSNFEPDLNNGKLGWIVGYSCHTKRLIVERFVYSYYGETIHYKTAEDAKKSIKENEQDWKIYFGIKEEE